MKVRPLHDRLIIQRLEEGEQTSRGIIVPDSAGSSEWGRPTSPAAALKKKALERLAELQADVEQE